MDDLVADAREFILEFRSKNYGIAPDGCQDSRFRYLSKQLRHSIEHLSEGLYGRDVHFILELIQNAEDNRYDGVQPDLEFLILDHDPTSTEGCEGCLCLFNNEVGFNEANVESICGIGQSTKEKRQGYVGEKGIGFKSVFVVSPQPHIISNGFRFCFKEHDPRIELAYIVPYWLDEVPAIVAERKTVTAILLPLKPGMRQEIIGELDRVRPETILFLSRLKSLSIEIRESGKRIDLIRDNSARPIVDLLVQSDGRQDRVDRYWLHERTLAVPADLRESKREGVEDRTVAVAFPLQTGEQRGRIFAFLPTEVESGLPFIANADFILSAGRETIQTTRRWNSWLRDALPAAVVEGIAAMLADKGLRKSAYGFIPLADKLQDARQFFAPLCEQVVAALGSRDIVLTDTGKMVAPERARLVGKAVRSLFKGDRRPAEFECLAFVDPGIQKWSSQLRAIGVRDLSVGEFQRCLRDASWLSARNPGWFLELYRYLHDSRLRDAKTKQRKFVEDLPVIPLDGGGVVPPSQGPVYYPGPREPVIKLGKALKAAEFPDVSFVNLGLLERLREDAGLMQWAETALGLTEFSIRKFILGSLLPWADENAATLTAEQALKCAQIIIDNWSRIEAEDEVDLRNMLPVVLDDGSVWRRGKLCGTELLVPRTLDPDKGWQLILVAEEDYGHEDVLSDAYVRLLGERKTIDKFLAAIGAETFPDLKTYQLHDSDAESSTPHAGYVKEQQSSFPANSTQTPRLETWMAPSFFYKKTLRESRKHRLALIHWLEGMIENRSGQLRKGGIHWFYYSGGTTSVASGLYFELRRQPWVRTTKGLSRPAEVFVKSRQLREMFGARLPYLKDEMSAALIEFLGIHTEATTEAILDYLNTLAENGGADTGLVGKLYAYLDEYGKDLKEPFAASPLILVPDSAKGWYRSGDVVWEELSSVFEDLYVYLAPSYEKQGLDRFFTRKLGVSETVGTEEMARAWLRLAKQEPTDAEQVRTALIRILPKVLSEARSDEAHPDWWAGFVSEARVWTSDERFLPAHHVLAGDDTVLRRLFADAVPFAWMPEILSHDRLDPLYKVLGVRRLTESVQISLASQKGISAVRSPRLLTPWSKRLLAYLLYNRTPERFDRLMATDVFPRLMQAGEFLCESLVLRFSLEGFSVSRTDSERHAFWSGQEGRLYLLAGADPDDLLDAAAEGIARALWGRQFREQVAAARWVLGVGNEARFRKLRDKNAWHLPPEQIAGITVLIETPPVRTTEIGDAPDTQVHGDEGKTSTDSEKDGVAPTGGKEAGASAAPGKGGGRTDRRAGPGDGAAATRTSSHPRSPGVRTRRSRSTAVDQRIRASRQNRIPVYVYHAGDQNTPREESSEEQQRREAIGEAAERFVYQTELDEGHHATRMPHGHPGYDIEVIDRHTGELRFIEVKGQDGAWGARGVGLSTPQFRAAVEKGPGYWLYIVEYARSQPRVSRIHDPAGQITEYRFDGSWAQLAVPTGEAASPEPVDLDRLAEELKAITDDPVCRSIIDACHDRCLDLPEVGSELIGDGDAVIGEIELAWPARRIGVVLASQQETGDAAESGGWRVFRVRYAGESSLVPAVCDALASPLDRSSDS